jgi:hypothetical protein
MTQDDILLEAGLCCRPVPPTNSQDIEVVRRLLIGSSTCIGEIVIHLLRGAPQGSPLSPFLAVIYFDDLAGEVEEYVTAHPEGAPTLGGTPMQGVPQYLLALLLYADDASLIGTTPEWLQGLLDAVSAWATSRCMSFNASKSETIIANLPGGRRAAAAAAPDLAVQGTPIPVVDSGRYLGVPIHGASLPGPNPAKGFPIKVEAVSQRMALVRKLFSVRIRGKSSVNLDFPLLSMLVKQQVFQKFLFPSPVVRVDTDAFDVRLRRELKSLLGLPRTYPSVLLHFQLAIWPSRFVTALRAMRFAWRLLHQSWIGPVIRSAWLREGRLRSKDPIFRYEPVKYLGDTMAEYDLSWGDLLDEKYTPCPNAHSKQRQLRWYTECRSRACDKIAQQYLADRRGLQRHVRPCMPSNREDIRKVIASNKVASFLQEFGDMARAALRLQAPILAVCPSTNGEPICKLCGEEPESPTHLVTDCSGLPQDMRQERARMHADRAMQVRIETLGKKLLPMGYATMHGPEWSASLQWEGRTQQLAARFLWFAGRAIDYYSQRVAPPPSEEPDTSTTVRVRSASRVRPCRLSPICRGRAALGHDVPGLAG